MNILSITVEDTEANKELLETLIFSNGCSSYKHGYDRKAGTVTAQCPYVREVAEAAMTLFNVGMVLAINIDCKGTW